MASTKTNTIVMTEGRPLPQVIRFAVPLALTGILQLLFNAADVIVVGKFSGSIALAAVGATSTLVNLIVNTFIGISVGVNILVARRIGCHDADGVSRASHCAVALSVLLGLLMMAIGLLGGSAIPLDTSLKGMFMGHTLMHTKAHFFRALLESHAYDLGISIDRIAAKYPEYKLDHVKIIGGGAKSRLWKQIIADVCNVKLLEVSTFSDSATSLGAAAAAGVGIGLFKSLPEAVRHISLSGSVEPSENAEELYGLTKKRYAMLYPALKEAFHTRA